MTFSVLGIIFSAQSRRRRSRIPLPPLHLLGSIMMANVLLPVPSSAALRSTCGFSTIAARASRDRFIGDTVELLFQADSRNDLAQDGGVWDIP